MLARRRLAGRGRAWPSNERRWGAGEGNGAARQSVRTGSPAPYRGGGRGDAQLAGACLLPGRDARAEERDSRVKVAFG